MEKNKKVVYIIKVIKSCQYIEQLVGCRNMVYSFYQEYADESINSLLLFMVDKKAKKVESCSLI